MGERMTQLNQTRGRPVVGAALSMVVPGAGQAYAGRHYRAAAFLGGILALALVAWSWLMWIPDPLATLLHPSALVWVLAIDLGLLTYRSWSVVDAYRLRRASTMSGTIGLVIVLAITALPHVGVAYAAFQLDRTVGRVFVAELELQSPTGTVPTPLSPAASSIPDAPAETRPSQTATTVANPVTTITGGEPATVPPAPRPFQPVSVLLLGGDAGPGRGGLRTDVIDVVSFIPATGRAVLFGIPRNLVSVPLPDTLADRYQGGTFPRMLNALHGEVQREPGAYAGFFHPGAEALEDTVGQLLGIEIGHHALVDMGGFVDVIDALGGVTIDVPVTLVDRLSPPKEGEDFREYVIPTGVQHLNGHQALAYVRSRTTSNDYDRMARQRCVLAALAGQVGALDVFTAVPRLAAALEAHVSTDVTVDLLPALIRVAGNVSSPDVITVRFVPPDYTAGADARGQPIPDIAAIRAAVEDIMSNLEDGTQPLTAGSTAGTACAWDG